MRAEDSPSSDTPCRLLIMAPKRPSQSPSEGEAKKQRRVMTLKEKLEVLEELESGKNAAEVGRQQT